MKRSRIPYLVGSVVLLAAGVYFFVYLWRWEWNRAMVAGLLFVAAEIGLGIALVLDRIRRMEEALNSAARSGAVGGAPPEVLARIRESAPPPHDHFEWLTPREGQMGVFVPVLMGMGAVASFLAWAVERVARATARPTLERGLAARLVPLAWPEGGLMGQGQREGMAVDGLLAGPGRTGSRRDGPTGG